ncbi:hypothetical protein CAPTEDRAFT_187537 [Capitella teleta]|uniref:EF-hand domain-containing protein n=1 Tax=Capitella teleta TaxID=283909 RepID=R7UJW7_CAPTE|nr:hypothetical protein CAPTEDRAFT_187537 [Capitella teleta]|eukprot:ELU04083.1 hypothetical protein CAPTEDRAFT_187537 [Capitella teleta]
MHYMTILLPGYRGTSERYVVQFSSHIALRGEVIYTLFDDMTCMHNVPLKKLNPVPITEAVSPCMRIISCGRTISTAYHFRLKINDTVNHLSKEVVEGSGSIDFEEFLGIFAKHWKDPVDEEKELMEAFQVFDREHGGFVVASEIKYITQQLGHDLIRGSGNYE